MGVNHGGPDITVSKKLLDGPDIVIGLEQMACKAVAKGMGGCPFGELQSFNNGLNRFLDMAFMQMVPTVFLCFTDIGQFFSRE